MWIVASIGFTVYVANFNSYDKTYGSLGGVVILLTWLYLSALMVLLGAVINAQSERQTRKDSTEGPPRAMGRRDAHAADTLGGSTGLGQRQWRTNEEIDRLKARLQWEGAGPLDGSVQSSGGRADRETARVRELGARDGRGPAADQPAAGLPNRLCRRPLGTAPCEALISLRLRARCGDPAAARHGGASRTAGSFWHGRLHLRHWCADPGGGDGLAGAVRRSGGVIGPLVV